MKLGIICGSHRRPSQSARVGHYMEQRLLDKGYCDEVFFLDLFEQPFPLWEEGIWAGDEQWMARLNPVSDELIACDGFIVIVPEYHGMVPSALKNFFLMWGKGELAHKPALITAVSSADGGSYPVAELRMSSYKNNRLCYIPEQLILRHVETILNDDGDNDEDADRYFRQRIDYAIGILHQYALALRSVRDSGVVFDPMFKNGM
ncbi:MAG: NAD(P)H-dependent oxidoreductase [Gammaproteobacteria bacterium]|nr:NAD(P)H-dependent oxidoreductase [Gammaproteobacteria bacterium]